MDPTPPESAPIQVGVDLVQGPAGQPAVQIQFGTLGSQSAFLVPPDGAVELGKLLIDLGQKGTKKRSSLIVSPMSDNIRNIIKKGPST